MKFKIQIPWKTVRIPLLSGFITIQIQVKFCRVFQTTLRNMDSVASDISEKEENARGKI